MHTVFKGTSEAFYLAVSEEDLTDARMPGLYMGVGWLQEDWEILLESERPAFKVQGTDRWEQLVNIGESIHQGFLQAARNESREWTVSDHEG